MDLPRKLQAETELAVSGMPIRKTDPLSNTSQCPAGFLSLSRSLVKADAENMMVNLPHQFHAVQNQVLPKTTEKPQS